MFKALLNFVFGKNPEIFDKDGNVRHPIAKEKWDAWQSRYLKGEEYNWRHHAGMRAKNSEGKPQAGAAKS